MDGVMRSIGKWCGGRAHGGLLPHGLLLAGVLLGAGACESGSPEPAKTASAPSAQKAAPGGPVNRYGGSIEPGTSVPLATLLANPKAYADQTVTTEGKVQRACSSKGCWMEIGEGDDACRVTFKDYAFFVPTDSAGAQAKIQGKLDTRHVEAAAVAHLESEGARFKHKNADGSAIEVRMIASAVELVR